MIDVQFGTFTEGGDPELAIGFFGKVGIHGVSLAGKRLWSNRACAPVLSVAISHEVPDWGRLAYATGRGGIVGVKRNGNEDSAKMLRGWALANLFTASFPDATQAAYIAIGVNDTQEPCVVGLNHALEETWSYPLSGSMFERPIDFVASGRLRSDSRGEWVVGWGDGTIHVVSENGEFDDSFGTGEQLRGVALLSAGKESLIVAATAHGVTAWRVAE